ncbi:hypothetical protein K438DRAFT_1628844, partial [Mycena galopus ATCC 62051]
YGNGAYIEDIAGVADCSLGSVENFTDRAFTAIEFLHDTFIRPVTPEEKEAEKCLHPLSPKMLPLTRLSCTFECAQNNALGPPRVVFKAFVGCVSTSTPTRTIGTMDNSGTYFARPDH